MLSQIIITKNSPIFIPSADTLVAPEDDHLKIDFVREIQKFISTSPITDKAKIIQIPNAVRLTIPAQNALLKTLEEPPEYAQINLYLAHKDQLLPTIQSRCVIINQSEALAIKTSTSDLPQKLKASLSERVMLADTYTKNRDLAVGTCQELIDSLREEQFALPTKINAQRLRLLNEGIFHLVGNANPHLTIEHIFIHWND
jgi:DNA polymerase III subunit delta'